MYLTEQQSWQTHFFYAMGCEINLWLAYEDARQAQQVLYQAEGLFRVMEARLTRFTQTSELARLNERPGQWVSVSAVMWEVVTRALQLAEETGGLFDPTMLNALEAVGYDRPFAEIPDTIEGEDGQQFIFPEVNWYDVGFDAERQVVCLPTGLRLDLGGIGKGFTAQKVVNFLNQWGPCLVDAGGDLTAGDGPVGWPGWPVGVAVPWSRQQVEPANLLRLWLCNGTLATSGIDYRRWQRNGVMVHHVIDPRTGKTAVTDVLTVSVLATDACRAEAWATAALVAGVELGGEALMEQKLPGVFVDEAGGLVLTAVMEPLVELDGDALGRLV